MHKYFYWLKSYGITIMQHFSLLYLVYNCELSFSLNGCQPKILNPVCSDILPRVKEGDINSCRWQGHKYKVNLTSQVKTLTYQYRLRKIYKRKFSILKAIQKGITSSILSPYLLLFWIVYGFHLHAFLQQWKKMILWYCT